MTAPSAEGTGVLVFGPPTGEKPKPTLAAALAREEQRSAYARASLVAALMSAGLVMLLAMTAAGFMRGMHPLEWWTITGATSFIVVFELVTLATLRGVLARPVVLEARQRILYFRFLVVAL